MGALIKLVVPPFVPVNQPSLGVSSLVAVLKEAGYEAEACYLNLAYLATIGTELYSHLSNSFRGSYLSGEFLFTPALTDTGKPDWQAYENLFFANKNEKLRKMGKEFDQDQDQIFSEQCAALFAQSNAVIHSWAKSLLSDEPKIVGFSSTFQQTIASLALARKIKELSGNRVITLLGGANCRGDMGQAILDNFPWMDYVVSGEGESCIVELVRGALGDNIPSTRKLIEAQVVSDMDSLPTPDFHDYFARCTENCFDFDPHLVAESSRGCWWGSKSHCSFCGLNGENLSYRHKSPRKIVSEIKELHTTYGKSFFMMTDNILHRDIGTALHENFKNSDMRFFYEVKANLSKKHLIELAQTGVLWIQPGIENLSTPLLKRINKGTSQLQNIQTLKHCTELNLGVSWNILYNLPGETEEDYQTNCSIIPKIYHLLPPSAIPMRLERFSSYWRNPEQYQLSQLRHSWPYDFLYKSLPLEQRSRMATYFEYYSPEEYALAEQTKTLLSEIAKWVNKPRSTTLLQFHDSFNDSLIIDSRTGTTQQTYLSRVERELLHRLDSIISFDRLYESVAKEGMGGETVSRDGLQTLLHTFEERQWVITENSSWLSLVMDPSLKNSVYQ